MSFSYGFDNENIKKRRSHVQFMLSDIILARWRRPVASSEALDLLHWEMRAVTYRRIAMAIKTATVYLLIVVCLPVALAAAGAIRSPMPASSGFQSSPGHAALGDSACIASTPHHGHQHGLQRRGICS